MWLFRSPPLQRFLPSEFGHDVNRADPVEPGLNMYREKRRVRQLVEESGIPFTYICCNSIASWPYYNNIHPSEVLPPTDFFQIYGDGNVKGKQKKETGWMALAGSHPFCPFYIDFLSKPPPLHTSRMFWKRVLIIKINN